MVINKTQKFDVNSFQALNDDDLAEFNGGNPIVFGVIAAVVGVGGLALGIYNAGYNAGKDRALAGKRR
jgi:lactobin A/cerein 7B family class IIb bacteriocin